MKLKLQFSIFILCISTFTFAQETTVDFTMGAGYANQVYYKLSTATQTDFVANSWDVALLRTSAFDQGLVVNDGIGIEVFEAGAATEWDAIDVNNETTWTPLYNSDTERVNGAFMQGSATYGWGEYNVATHLVTGTVVFVLKYVDGSYKKFICEQYAAGYTLKYASWNGTTWEEDTTAVISNTTNVNNNYNYYSLQNNEEVVAAPAATDWDLVFRQYKTDVGGGAMYSVTGVLQGDGVQVAQTTATEDATDLTYTADINTIGYDWKSLNFETFTFDVASDIHYYVKDADENIFKLYFTEFGGTATGDVQFKFENITETLGIETLEEDVSFGVYPNPVSSHKKINILLDVDTIHNDAYRVAIYNVTGKQVYQTKITSSSGFYTQELDISNLNSGVYTLMLSSGNSHEIKKIIVQ